MPDQTPEKIAKTRFAKFFQQEDWLIFKKVAEINLSEAAYLKKKSFTSVPSGLRLLARNSRKRLLIGVGVELLLKAVYLKSGYCINKPTSKDQHTFPFKLADVQPSEINISDTFTLAPLIDKLPTITEVIPEREVISRGFRVAKVFRNKEGHVVTQSHEYEASEYRAIESALVSLYKCAFSQNLVVRFAVEKRDRPCWEFTD